MYAEVEVTIAPLTRLLLVLAAHGVHDVGLGGLGAPLAQSHHVAVAAAFIVGRVRRRRRHRCEYYEG